MGRFFLLLFLFLFLYYLLILFLRGLRGGGKKSNRATEPEELVQDPYCLTYISKRRAIHKKISGKDHYFCNRECLKKYVNQEKKVDK